MQTELMGQSLKRQEKMFGDAPSYHCVLDLQKISFLQQYLNLLINLSTTQHFISVRAFLRCIIFISCFISSAGVYVNITACSAQTDNKLDALVLRISVMTACIFLLTL